MTGASTESPQQSLLFIPDISGFTQFIGDTDIVHSKHIIEELLELLIDANEMDLKMAEIEGDAILFYRPGSPPDATTLLSQIQRMFINFHTHLRKYDTTRICQCGACTNAHTLSLKFFCHYGEISMNQVKDQSKPFGREVIVIHRLMKNNVDNREYVLVTDEITKVCPNWEDIVQTAWSTPVRGEETYDMSTIKFSYIPLETLKKHVPPPTHTDYSIRGATELLIEVEKVIEAPMELVFDVISDLSFRHHWFIGLKGSDMLNHKISQSGSTHRCVMKEDASDPFFVDHDFKVSDDLITFVETNKKEGFSGVYFLRRLGKGLTRVEFKIFTKPNFIKRWLFNLMMKKKLMDEFQRQLVNLNTYCKQLVTEGRQHPNRVELRLRE